MYVSIEEFQQDWKSESELTKSLIATLTDESLNQKVWDGGRTLGKIAAHIAATISEMMNQSGLEINPPAFGDNAPKNAKEVVEAYSKAADELIHQINLKWNDEQLAEPLQMYGQTWTYGMLLNVLIRHEIHHRAQMTVLMRQAGLIVPGIYGPAKEEWSSIGMPVHD